MPSVLGNTPLGTSIALESDLEQQVVAVGKPFDAECEYVSFPAGSYVDPEIVDIGMTNAYDVDASIRIPTFGFFRFGNWRNNAQNESFMIWNYDTNSNIRCCKYASDGSGASNATGFFGITTTSGSCTINGTTRTFTVPSGSSSRKSAKFLICALDNKTNGTIDVSGVQIDIAYFRFIGNTMLRDLLPVRVGQVGYLYDKVTGRLFGSATSTALVPGPDVAVPTFTPKTEIDLLAPLASPAFTGTPTAPTASSGTNTTQVATTAFVQSAVGGLDLSIVSGKLCVSFEE